jgi:AbiU2
MNAHVDFFRASYDAHYVAYHVYVGVLFDTTKGTASIAAYLQELKQYTQVVKHDALVLEYEALRQRAKTLVIARNKTVAHIDRFLTDKAVFAEAPAISYDQTRDLIYDTARFVAKLAGYENDLGSIGIGRDRRLSEATLTLIRALPRTN